MKKTALLVILFSLLKAAYSQNTDPSYYTLPIQTDRYSHQEIRQEKRTFNEKKIATFIKQNKNQFLLQNITDTSSVEIKKNAFLEVLKKKNPTESICEKANENPLYKILSKAHTNNYYNKKYYYFPLSDSVINSYSNALIMQLTNIGETKLTPTNILSLEKDPKYTLSFPILYLFSKKYLEGHGTINRNKFLLPVITGSMAAKDAFTTIVDKKKIKVQPEIAISGSYFPVKRLYYKSDSLKTFRTEFGQYLCKKDTCPCDKDPKLSGQCSPCLCALLYKPTKDTMTLSVNNVHHLWYMWFTGKAGWIYSNNTIYTPDSDTLTYAAAEFVEKENHNVQLLLEWNNYVYHHSGVSFYTNVSFQLNTRQTNIDDLTKITGQRTYTFEDTITHIVYTKKLDDLVGYSGEYHSLLAPTLKFRQIFLFGSVEKEFYIGLGPLLSYTYFNKKHVLDSGFSIEAPIQNKKDNNVVNLSLTFTWKDVTQEQSKENKKKLTPLVGLQVGVPLPTIYLKKG